MGYVSFNPTVATDAQTTFSLNSTVARHAKWVQNILCELTGSFVQSVSCNKFPHMYLFTQQSDFKKQQDRKDELEEGA